MQAYTRAKAQGENHLMMKKWVIGKTDSELAEQLAQKCDLSPLCLKILISRGLDTLDRLSDFFTGVRLEDPFDIKDMRAAVDTVNKAIEGFDRICVYGDYDCDGVTATALLYSYLECSGADVMYYIPERAEGYGLNAEAIRRLADQGVKLIITVDNGISAVSEAELIAELGMELVITDHHRPPEVLPRAAAVVDPHRADCASLFKDLAGVGVALKLCAALDGGSYDAVLEQYADIAAVGTIADVVPLNGENRTIAALGLRLLKNTENRGLIRLTEKTGVNPETATSTDLSFTIAPRINAAGRFGSPITALKLLLTEDDYEAEDLASELCDLNSRRRSCELQIAEDIREKIDRDRKLLDQKVIILDGAGWHAGVIGIVAAKISEAYGKPCILLSVDESGEARGSARSVAGFSIFKCLSACADLLEHFGGHERAGGLTLRAENIGEFRKKVAEYADSLENMPFFELHADKQLTREDLTVGQIESLSVLEPFGEGNPVPVFAVIGAKVQNVIPLSQGKHTRLDVSYESTVLKALCFGRSPQSLGVCIGDTVDMLVTVGVSEYNGRKSIELKIKDIRLSGIKQTQALSAMRYYESFSRGERVAENILALMRPVRSDMLSAYRALNVHKSMPLEMLGCRMFLQGINFAKTRICAEAFCQTGLAKLCDGGRTLTLLPTAGKVCLGDAPIMKDIGYTDT